MFKYIVLGLLFCQCSLAAITGKPISVKTSKFAFIYGKIGSESYNRFKIKMEATSNLPGDRIIVINSGGGWVSWGFRMLGLINQEKKQGTKIICLVEGHASSMAFNILSQCDKRYATKNSKFLLHKVSNNLECNVRYTSAYLQKVIDSTDIDDAMFDSANMKALGLNKIDYDLAAELETLYTVEDLIKLGYLNGVVESMHGH